MSDPRGARPAEEHKFAEIADGDRRPADSLAMSDLYRVRLDVEAELGTCSMSVREVLELTRGSIIALDKLAGEMADVRVNGLPLARGEVVVLGDGIHIRISEISGSANYGHGAENVDDEDALGR